MKVVTKKLFLTLIVTLATSPVLSKTSYAMPVCESESGSQQMTGKNDKAKTCKSITDIIGAETIFNFLIRGICRSERALENSSFNSDSRKSDSERKKEMLLDSCVDAAKKGCGLLTDDEAKNLCTQAIEDSLALTCPVEKAKEICENKVNEDYKRCDLEPTPRKQLACIRAADSVYQDCMTKAAGDSKFEKPYKDLINNIAALCVKKARSRLISIMSLDIE